MDNELNDELLRWYAQFHQQQQHDEQRAELLDRLQDSCDTLPRTSNCDDLETYYTQFTQDHGELRESMLEQLSQTVARTIAATSRREWLVGVAPRLAASVLVAATGGGLLTTAFSKPLYAIEDVVGRVQSAPKMHLRGTRLDGLPFEIYIERPNRFWATYQQTVTDMDKKRIGLTTGHRASDGKIRYLHEDSREGYFPIYHAPFAEEDLPIWSRIELESLVTEVLGEEMLFQQAAGFKFIERTELDGRLADVFERRLGERILHRLHVDPTTHVPVQVEGVLRSSRTNQNKVMWCMDEINLDPSGPPDHIQFKQFDPAEIAPLSSPVRRFSRATIRPLVAPFQLRVGQSCLCCWTADETMVVGEPFVQIVNQKNALFDCQLEDLGTTFDGVSYWHWKLLELPHHVPAPRIAIQYDEHVVNKPTRRKSLRRTTPIDVTLADIAELLTHMANHEEATRILSRLQFVNPGHKA